jgi:organic hydroperoxide reductase OsmC/OhrA
MEHKYHVKVSQNHGGQGGAQGRVGSLTNPKNNNFPKITIQSPGEFKGPVDAQDQSLHWTPEDLYVSSIAVCLFTTFVAFAEKARLNYQAFRIEAEGKLEKVPDNSLQITQVHQDVYITINDAAEEKKTKNLLEKAERHCLIANSVKTKIGLMPHIEFS